MGNPDQMTQLTAYKSFVRECRWNLTLGQILRTTFAAEYRKLHTLLRHEGWKVVCVINRKAPGGNTYGFIEPRIYTADGTGQLQIFEGSQDAANIQMPGV